MVQHIGTSSSLFNKDGVLRNRKYHSATEFPIRVGFPGFEEEGVW
jgi:hypothetical protein